MERITTIHFPAASLFSDVVICGAGYHQLSSNTPKNDPRFKARIHARYSLHLIVSGQGDYQFGERTYHLKKGQLFALFPNEDITYTPNKRYPWKYYWIDFYGLRAEEFLARMGFTTQTPIANAGESYKNLEKLFLSNIVSCQNDPDNTDSIALSHLLQIYCELIRKKTFRPAVKQSTQSYTKKAMEYIRKNYSDPHLSLKLVAAKLNINEAYLSRLFRSELDINFTDYVTKVRLAAAVALMDEGQSVICEIAVAVGFSDPYYFSKVFKKLNNCSPREHVKKLQNSKLNENPPYAKP